MRYDISIALIVGGALDFCITVFAMLRRR